MNSALIDRLEIVAGELLTQNRRLETDCQQLRQEKAAWQQERQELLRQVEGALRHFESLPPEDC